MMATAETREWAFELLRSGKSGVRTWNEWRCLGRRPPDLSKVNLHKMNLEGAELHGVNLREANLNEANVGGGNLGAADLTCAQLIDSKLFAASLERANLSQARLDRSELYGANLSFADLRGANLEGADLSKAFLRGAQLVNASFEGAKLIRADLAGANLHGANLAGANLDGANLDGANLAGADCRRMQFKNASFQRVQLSKNSSFSADADLLSAEWAEILVEHKVYSRESVQSGAELLPFGMVERLQLVVRMARLKGPGRDLAEVVQLHTDSLPGVSAELVQCGQDSSILKVSVSTGSDSSVLLRVCEDFCQLIDLGRSVQVTPEAAPAIRRAITERFEAGQREILEKLDTIVIQGKRNNEQVRVLVNHLEHELEAKEISETVLEMRPFVNKLVPPVAVAALKSLPGGSIAHAALDQTVRYLTGKNTTGEEQ